MPFSIWHHSLYVTVGDASSSNTTTDSRVWLNSSYRTLKIWCFCWYCVIYDVLWSSQQPFRLALCFDVCLLLCSQLIGTHSLEPIRQKPHGVVVAYDDVLLLSYGIAVCLCLHSQPAVEHQRDCSCIHKMSINRVIDCVHDHGRTQRSTHTHDEVEETK